MLYKLSEEEIKVALAEASRRQSLNEAKGLKGRNGGAETGEKALFFHQVGCLGEMAVASYLGLKDALFQESDAVRGSFDLPFCIDVKTRTKHYYDLIVQLDEEPGKNYWLVTIQNKTIRIHGWIEHDQCTKPEYVKDPAKNRSAYFVPQSALRSPESFRAEVMDKQQQVLAAENPLNEIKFKPGATQPGEVPLDTTSVESSAPAGATAASGAAGSKRRPYSFQQRNKK